MSGIPLVALQGTTPTVNGAANFIDAAKAKSDIDTAKLNQAGAAIGLMGQVALGAMGGNINGQADPTKWAQGQALLKAHGIDMSQYGPDFAPTLARASVSTLGQLQTAQTNQDLQIKLAQFSHDLSQDQFTNQLNAAKTNYEMHDQLQPNSMFGMTTPDQLRAQSGLPPAPTITAPSMTAMPNVGALGASSMPALSAPALGAPAPSVAQPTIPLAQPIAQANGVSGYSAPSPDITSQLRTGINAGGSAAVPAAAPTAPQGGALGLPDVSLGPDGKPDPAAQAAFLQALPPNLASLVQKAANYQLAPSQMFTLRSGNDRAMFDAVMAKYDPTYDANQYAARAAYLKKFTAGTIGDNITSASTTIGHLAQLAGNADAMHNQSLPLWNAVANTYKTQTGQPEVTNFDTNAKAAGDELAKFFKGTGATDVGSIDAWRATLDHNASPEQIHGAIDTAVGLLKSRLDALEQQYETTMGHAPPAGYSAFMRPEAQQALVKMGYDPITLEKTDAASQGNVTPAAPNTTTTGVKWSIVQ